MTTFTRADSQRTRLAPAAAALLLCAGLPACRSSDNHSIDEEYPPVETSELGSMNNVSVAGQVWFGGVPSEEDLDLAKRRGIEQVIDLCTTDEQPEYDLATVCVELDLELFQVQLVSEESIGDQLVDQVLGELDRTDQPKLIFCGTGSRSAMLFAIYRASRQGVPLEQALIEARRAGMKPGQPEEFVRAQVERLHDA
jgi:protein tyrosine phosphatase (PTP) superfamily phosphohydrolase (DUF442 family)